MQKPERIAFVCPRFADGPTVGGAETLLKAMAARLTGAGCQVDFLTTCATNHFTWQNELPAGVRQHDGMQVHYFPVDDGRDLSLFLKVQDRISRGAPVSAEDEDIWIRHNVNSDALLCFLRDHARNYRHIVAGPYLFGLIVRVTRLLPESVLLVPCLHDEPFAALGVFKELFQNIKGCLFNTHPERALAVRLYGPHCAAWPVVGMGIDTFEADPDAFRQRSGIDSPYLMYAGRREPMKGTNLLLDYMTALRARTGKDLKLVLTGTGPVQPPPALAPHMIDLGFVSEQHKRETMAGALAFCHPSAYESLGIVALEAWQAGSPVLARAQSEVLRHHCLQSGGGLWFRNYPEFEEEVVLLMEDPHTRKSLAAAGKRYVLREYSWPAVDARLQSALGVAVPV